MSNEILFQQNLQFHHPFLNKNIVFTGALSKMTRSHAAKLAKVHGANILGTVSPHCDFVILGNKQRGISTKHQKALQLIALGYPLELLNEEDFYWLLAMDTENK